VTFCSIWHWNVVKFKFQLKSSNCDGMSKRSAVIFEFPKLRWGVRSYNSYIESVLRNLTIKDFCKSVYICLSCGQKSFIVFLLALYFPLASVEWNLGYELRSLNKYNVASVAFSWTHWSLGKVGVNSSLTVSYGTRLSKLDAVRDWHPPQLSSTQHLSWT